MNMNFLDECLRFGTRECQILIDRIIEPYSL